MNSNNNEIIPIHDSILKVFLSHASEDRRRVLRLYNRLRQNGINAWIDKEKLYPGEHVDLEIKNAIKSSDVVIICLSKKSIKKEGYFQKEIKYALETAKEKLSRTIFIIPLKLEKLQDFEIPDELRRYEWLDYFGRKENCFKKLMQSLEKRAKESGKIIAPPPNSEINDDELLNFLKEKINSFDTKISIKDLIKNLSKNCQQYNNLRESIPEFYDYLEKNHFIVQANNPETFDNVVSLQKDYRYRHIYKLLILADETTISLIQRFLKDGN